MHKRMLTMAVALAAGGVLAFDAEKGLEEARAAQLRQTSARLLPVAVTTESPGVVKDSKNLLKLDGQVATFVNKGNVGRPWVVLDIGEASASGYAVIHVKGFRGARQPVLRLSYACYPEVAAKFDTGDYPEVYRGCYMTHDVEIPVLPANVFRHELYTISRTGTIIAPMHQPQFRYARVTLDSTDTEVDIDGIEWVVGDYYDRQDLAGYFKSSDPVLDRNWQIGVWTAQLATIRDVHGWRAIDGWLLPRKLEKGPEASLCNAVKLPETGKLSTVFELRHNPARISSVGFALFAKDPENALLLELDERGVARWIRRRHGEDNVLREALLVNAGMRDGMPYRLELRWRPLGMELFLSKGIDIDIVLNGINLGTFHYYHCPQGDKFGLHTQKNFWPMFDFVEILDKDDKSLFRDDFDDPALAAWDFPRPNPFVSDGAKRDRLVWSGDLWWAGRNIYYSLPDVYGMRDSVKLLAHAQTPEGFIHACPYAEIPKPKSGEYGMFESDEFAAWFVPVLYDYWLYTADRKTLDYAWPSLVKLMDYLDSYTGKDGLFNQRFETSKHAFAAGLQAGDVSHRSYMDILLYECRKDAAQMARDRGDAALAAKWAAAAERTKAAVFKNYWVPAKGCFKAQVEPGRWDWDNKNLKMVRKPGDPWAMEANSFALAAHLLTPEQAATVSATVHDNKGVIKYVVMAARGKAEYGMGDEAWTMISTNNWRVYTDKKHPWNGAMATPEGMNLWREGCGDQSHPDTALAGFISTAFLGVVPVEPGFKVFKFEPHPYAKLRFAEGRVPTPFGPIDARWERRGGGFAYAFTVPKGTTCLLNGKAYGPGRHEVIEKGVPKALLVHPDEFTDRWVDRAKALGIRTLSMHPAGGGGAHKTLEDLLARCRDPKFRARVDRAKALGLNVEYEMHAGTWLLPRDLFKEHPDWFRVGKDGKRTPHLNFCVSNEEALKFIGARVQTLVKGLYGSSHRHFFWLDDSGDSACHCAKCAKFTPSDQQLLVFNRLLAEIRRVEPDAQLAYLAYADAIVPPKTVKPAPGIFLEYAPIGRRWNKPIVEQSVVKGADVDRLLAYFGKKDSRVLEYWVDNSLFSRWTKPPKKFTPNNAVMVADFDWYAKRGFEEIASFACFLGDDYEALWGEPDVSAFGVADKKEAGAK